MDCEHRPAGGRWPNIFEQEHLSLRCRAGLFEVVRLAARITDRKKKKIVADYLELGSYNAVAKLNGVCGQTVRRIVEESPNFTENLKQKKAENTADVLAYMESKRGIVCEIIDKGLAALNDPEKLAAATPAQITTALGTLIDKWNAVEKDKPGDEVKVIIDV